MLICVRLYVCIYIFIYMTIMGHRRSRAKHNLYLYPLPSRDIEDSLLRASYYMFAQQESRSIGNLSEELLLRKL